MRSVKVVPRPSSDSTRIVPLWRSTISLVIARPTPRPPETRSRLTSERQKRPKVCGMSSYAMPMPVSCTATSTSERSCLSETFTQPSALV